VTHLEDEPRVLFDLLVAQGISPGMKVEVLESPDDRIRFSVDGRGVTLDAAAAGNITVHQREEDSTLPGFEWDGLTLEDIGPDEAGVVVELSPACQGTQRRRLLDLGVVPGTIIEPVLTATTGDPTAYRIRGALIALRRDQQRWIRVRRAEEEAA
jgi:DtxR family Mn-dependent transcriptional regulator